MATDNEYQLALEQANKLADRRQAITTTYLSVNAALTGAIAFLFKDGRLPDISSQVTVLALLFSGVVACGLWRRLIKHYSALTGWWYEQIRSLENYLGTKLFVRRAHLGRIFDVNRIRPCAVASRSRAFGFSTSTGPIPVWIARTGSCP